MKIAIYARVSTERQEQQKTIRSQVDALKEYAKKNNHTVIDEYIDDGWSGEIMARPGMDRLRDDAKKNLFEGALIHSPDRLARNYAYQYLIKEELEKNKVKLLFFNREIGDNPEDQLLLGFQGLIAEYEKGKILERTRRGRLAKARRGDIVGSLPPYGYTYVKKNEKRNGYYKILETEAKVVRLIYKWFTDDRLSIRGITKKLTQENIQPRGGKGKWAKSSVARIIRNNTYTGITYYNKYASIESPTNVKYKRSVRTGRKLRNKSEWIPISVPSIIGQDVFDRAQKQLKENVKLSPRNIKNHYLLRGLVVCKDCGSPYYGTPVHDKTFYRCGNRHRNFPLPRTCSASMVSTHILEPLVWGTVCEALINPNIIMSQVKRIKNTNILSIQETSNEITRLDKDINNEQQKEKRLLDAYSEGAVELNQLKDKMVNIKENIKRLNEQKNTCQTQQNNPTYSIISRGIKYYCKHVSKRLNNTTFDEKQFILQSLVRKIEFGHNQIDILGAIPVNTEDKQSTGSTASTTSFFPDRPVQGRPFWPKPSFRSCLSLSWKNRSRSPRFTASPV